MKIHNRIGLYTWGSPTYFDNVRIYASPAGIEYKAAEAAGRKAVYDEFNKFCIENFGAGKEPFVYEKFGKELKFVDQKKDTWQHISENSACFAFETNLPAKTYVEYGETAEYGKKTPLPERHFYLHLHYVNNRVSRDFSRWDATRLVCLVPGGFP